MKRSEVLSILALHCPRKSKQLVVKRQLVMFTLDLLVPGNVRLLLRLGIYLSPSVVPLFSFLSKHSLAIMMIMIK